MNEFRKLMESLDRISEGGLTLTSKTDNGDGMSYDYDGEVPLQLETGEQVTITGAVTTVTDWGDGDSSSVTNVYYDPEEAEVYGSESFRRAASQALGKNLDFTEEGDQGDDWIGMEEV